MGGYIMKKIIAFALAIALALSLCGCIPSTSTQPTVQKVTDPSDPSAITYKDYDNTLEGLCKYLAALGYAYDFKDATGDESTDPVVMQAEMIGAERGYKFSYTYKGDSAVLELYYYKDTTGDHYKQVQSEGKLTIADIEGGTVEATLSKNGKYMMVYSDTGENDERTAALLEAFTGFYA